MRKIFCFLIIILILILIAILICCCCDCCFRCENWKNVRITESPGRSLFPNLAWNGAGYGVAWMDGRDQDYYYMDIFFTKINRKGERLTGDIKISTTTNTVSKHPDIVWTGNEYGIIWEESHYEQWAMRDDADMESGGPGVWKPCHLHFARLDAEGNMIGYNMLAISNYPYNNCPHDSSLEWTGSEYGVSWHQSTSTPAGWRNIALFNRLNTAGEKQGSDMIVHNDDYRYNISPVARWTGNEYGIIWEGRQWISSALETVLKYTRLDASGVKQIDDVIVDGVTTTSDYWLERGPSMTWNGCGENFGITWNISNNYNLNEVRFNVIDQDGNKQIEDVIVTSDTDYIHSSSSVISWANLRSEYGIALQQWETADPHNSSIQFVTYNTEGNVQDAMIQISNLDADATTTTLHALHPDLIWNHRKYSIAWDDGRDSNDGEEIYFAAQYSCSLRDIWDFIRDLLERWF